MESVRARLIPSIERLRQSPRARALEAEYGREAVVSALRAEAAALRTELAAGAATKPSGVSPAAGASSTGGAPAIARAVDLPSASASVGAPSADVGSADAHADAGAGTFSADLLVARLLDQAATRLARTLRSRLRPVINATGVIIHTNLGRAPLCATALDRVNAIGRGYVSLEYDLEQGRRGRRDVHAEPLLCHLTGAEAAIVVNNNAAAVLLMLSALALGREAIISRGELVEIGGGFRVPDVMRQSGALLREVGTTNRTRVADYAAAISDCTALILRVHPSNFVIHGFTERPPLDELAALGRQFHVPVVEDLGSGFLEAARDEATAPDAEAVLPDEPSVQASLRAGVDVVTFSGDKLLGGPQAGIIAGRRALIDIMRQHPLMRALRVDKLTYAALEGTLIEYARGRAASTVPVRQMLALDAATLTARANALAARAASTGTVHASIVDGESAIGGGSAPGLRLPTPLVAIAIDGFSADALLARLRSLDSPIVARIDRDRLVFDLRTVMPAQDDTIAEALLRLASPRTP
jgi:L-seryl-tRNA(Ser) seleniumtransferase